MDEEHVGEPLIIKPEHPDRKRVREALAGGGAIRRQTEELMAGLAPVIEMAREMQQVNQTAAEKHLAIQERVAVALEAIAGELREAREHPKFVATGMMVVKEGSPEHIQAALATGAIPRGPRG